MVRTTETTVVSRLLNRYLRKGTDEESKAPIRLAQLSMVGFFTKNRGGNRNSSSYGLKAVTAT